MFVSFWYLAFKQVNGFLIYIGSYNVPSAIVAFSPFLKCLESLLLPMLYIRYKDFP
jgi:hypothetical protein